MILKHVPKKKLLLFAGDIFLISQIILFAPLILAWLSGGNNSGHSLWICFMVGVIYSIVFYIFDLYEMDMRFKSPKYLFRYFNAMAIATLIIIGILFFLPNSNFGRTEILFTTILVMSVCYIWRLFFEVWFKKFLLRQKNILIVGAGRSGKTLYKTVKDYLNYSVLGFIDDDPAKWGTSNSPTVLGGSALLNEQTYIGKVDAIIIAITHLKSQDMLKCVLESKMRRTRVYDMPSFYEEITGKIPVNHVDDFWFVSTPISGLDKNIYNLKVKRIIDILLSVIVITTSLVVTIPVAILIKLDSTGPVFYRQRRIGLNSKGFVCIKFRSMGVGTEHDRRFAGQVNDPRITRIGKIIRKLRIDEIPQLVNVLKGEMSFIGPRALIEEEVKEFKVQIPYFDLRHSVRPGITGWAQVNYKHGATVEDGLEKLQYDLFYIKNLSPMLDFHVLLKTVKVVLFGRGAR
ncbi:MAG: sugar transferase [Geobacter sp.]|nr:sugar transferase [Geobacter sp.]